MPAAVRTKGRRPAGDGSVYKAPDGRWRGVADLGWVDGRRRRKYVSGVTQGEALTKLREVQRTADAGVVSDDRLTLGQFLTRWVKVNLPGNVSGTTLDDYSHTVRLHLDPALGRKKLESPWVLWRLQRLEGWSQWQIQRSIRGTALSAGDEGPGCADGS